MSYDGYIPYPKFLYHATESARIVKSEAEHQAIGAGWYESPVEAIEPVKRGKRGKKDSE